MSSRLLLIEPEHTRSETICTALRDLPVTVDRGGTTSSLDGHDLVLVDYDGLSSPDREQMLDRIAATSSRRHVLMLSAGQARRGLRHSFGEARLPHPMPW